MNNKFQNCENCENDFGRKCYETEYCLFINKDGTPQERGWGIWKFCEDCFLSRNPLRIKKYRVWVLQE